MALTTIHLENKTEKSSPMTSKRLGGDFLIYRRVAAELQFPLSVS